ncbi:MAG: hypothetical protein JO006_14690 [Paucibacter sp.]|nr:hypothetical protein [Roseateles sp.]
MKTCTALAALLALFSALAHADNLSAPAAEAALAQGALAWDVRSAAASGLPGARRADAGQIDAWLARGDLQALQAAVSQAGLDLSRDVVVYGDAGDERARALVDSLQAVSPGRVHWLVGGAAEWSQSGRRLDSLSAHAPVPQHLVLLGTETGRMAGAALRGVALEQVLALR